MQSVTHTKLTHLELTRVWLRSLGVSTCTAGFDTERTVSSKKQHSIGNKKMHLWCDYNTNHALPFNHYFVFWKTPQHTRWEVTVNRDPFDWNFDKRENCGISLYGHKEYLKKRDEGRWWRLVHGPAALQPCLGYLQQKRAAMRLKTFREQVLVMWHRRLSAQTGVRPLSSSRQGPLYLWNNIIKRTGESINVYPQIFSFVLHSWLMLWYVPFTALTRVRTTKWTWNSTVALIPVFG